MNSDLLVKQVAVFIAWLVAVVSLLHRRNHHGRFVRPLQSLRFSPQPDKAATITESAESFKAEL